jgi:hypothetical protein
MHRPLDAAFSGRDQGQVTGFVFIFMNDLGCDAAFRYAFRASDGGPR